MGTVSTKKSTNLKEEPLTWIKLQNLNFTENFRKQIKVSAQKRIFRANIKNDHSSRSHHIFQIKIFTPDKFGKIKESLLSIVDLAGSERLEKPYAAEDQIRHKGSS